VETGYLNALKFGTQKGTTVSLDMCMDLEMSICNHIGAQIFHRTQELEQKQLGLFVIP